MKSCSCDEIKDCEEVGSCKEMKNCKEFKDWEDVKMQKLLFPRRDEDCQARIAKIQVCLTIGRHPG